MNLIATTRRRMLLGLAAASTASSSGASATGLTVPQVAPELVAMGDSLSDVLGVYKACTADCRDMGAAVPRPDQEILIFGQGCVEPVDILGIPIKTAWKPGGFEQVRHIGKPEALASLKELVGQIILFREKSVTGLIIKAQAMQVWEQAPRAHQLCNLDAMAWASAMSKNGPEADSNRLRQSIINMWLKPPFEGGVIGSIVFLGYP